MPAITVRPLNAGDIPRVLEIQAACREAASWSKADYRHLEGRDCPPWRTTVALKDELIAGFLTYTAPGAGDREILNLAVDPDHRRQGVAGTLLRELLRQISGPLFLEVRAGNRTALSFYGKLGFAETGRRRFYYRNPVEDAIIMILSR